MKIFTALSAVTKLVQDECLSVIWSWVSWIQFKFSHLFLILTGLSYLLLTREWFPLPLKRDRAQILNVISIFPKRAAIPSHQNFLELFTLTKLGDEC
jgi:hypothetical protein